MKNLLLSLFFGLICLPFFGPAVIAQQSILWTDIEDSAIKNNPARVITPLAYRTVQLSPESFNTIVSQAPVESAKNAIDEDVMLELPMPDGSTAIFRIVESPVMAKELAAKFPQIKTWAGVNIDNPSETVRFDRTPKGFHAMVLSPKGAVFIDPYHRNTTELYISYYKKDFVTHKTFHCMVEDELPLDPGRYTTKGGGNASVGNELRTYRLAVSATGEYTNYHGGTVLGAMSAIATTMNRVNGIYIRDFSVKMELIANNDLVVYTDAANDPFGSGSDLINNHNSQVAALGSENFDVGHVLDFGGGGVASLSSVCSENRKGRGYTSGNPPEADPFDIDYVAHEMGHQFAGNHTFNHCQGSQGPVPTEPGSATTIMGYAGICGADNIQSNSNDHFHGINFDETYEFTVLGNANNCALITATGNTPPVANVEQDGYFIPVFTPFELSGSATDPDGDSLTYCWENMDMGPVSPPNSPSGATAIFRSFPPDNSPVRVFPQISDVVNNSQTIGEILPAYTRPLNFRMTVRDNQIGGGGVHSADYHLEVTETAGPFLVTEPNTDLSWEAGSCQEVRWDVANTDQMPVNSQVADILLSVDGGYTYPFLLAAGVPNSGYAIVTVPDTLGNQNRIKVKAADNVFFDISDQNFSIADPSAPGFTLLSQPEALEVCAPDDAVFDLYLCQLLGFSEEVSLSVTGAPTGTNAQFSEDIIMLPGSVALTVSNTAAAASGQYPLTVTAQSASLSHSIEIDLTIVSGAPAQVSLLSPSDGALDISRVTNLSWTADPNATQYMIQISDDISFDDILFEANGLVVANFEPPSSLLQGNTAYYWRVLASNNSCGGGDWSAPYSFRTEQVLCMTYISTQVPKIISATGTPVVQSSIPVFDLFTVEDINVIGLEGMHSRMEDLEFILRAPTMEEVELIPQVCNGAVTFRLNLDDDSANPLTCPTNDGGNYQPSGDLDDLSGVNSTGFWSLLIYDLTDGEGGVLESWGLVICREDLVPLSPVISPLESVLIFPNPAADQFDLAIISEKDRKLDLVITDVLGRTILIKKDMTIISGENERLTIGIRDFPDGIYFIQLFREDGKLYYSEKLSVHE